MGLIKLQELKSDPHKSDSKTKTVCKWNPKSATALTVFTSDVYLWCLFFVNIPKNSILKTFHTP